LLDDSAGADQKPASDQDKPSTMQRLKKHLKDQMSSGCVNAVGQHCWDKPPKDDTKKDDGSSEGSSEIAQQPPANQPLPRSSDESTSGQTGESSSKGTKIDLSPPPGEAPAPGIGGASDVQEMKPWDPHKSDKNVEVGDFYFKQKNYRAAESRYAEALYWQDNNAIAMFRLAEAEEKLGKFGEARKNYNGYLKILPDGEFSAKAKEGLERLKDKPNEQEKAEVRKK
jgi:tetratricopeptide (TPR) repeat protein